MLAGVNIEFLKELHSKIDWREHIITGEFFEGKQDKCKVRKIEYLWDVGLIDAGAYFVDNGSTENTPSDLVGTEATLYFIHSFEVIGSAVVSLLENTDALGGVSRDNLLLVSPKDGTFVVNMVNYQSTSLKFSIYNPSPKKSYIVIRFHVLKVYK